jgi:hypothetical protein
MFFNILLPIIKEVTNFRVYMIKVIENVISNKKRLTGFRVSERGSTNTNENKKRKFDKDYDKSNELFEEEIVVKKVIDNTSNIAYVDTIRNNKLQDKLDIKSISKVF